MFTSLRERSRKGCEVTKYNLELQINLRLFFVPLHKSLKVCNSTSPFYLSKKPRYNEACVTKALGLCPLATEETLEPSLHYSDLKSSIEIVPT